jgi:hypothetical protein
LFIAHRPPASAFFRGKCEQLVKHILGQIGSIFEDVELARAMNFRQQAAVIGPRLAAGGSQ